MDVPQRSFYGLKAEIGSYPKRLLSGNSPIRVNSSQKSLFLKRACLLKVWSWPETILRPRKARVGIVKDQTSGPVRVIFLLWVPCHRIINFEYDPLLFQVKNWYIFRKIDNLKKVWKEEFQFWVFLPFWWALALLVKLLLRSVFKTIKWGASSRWWLSLYCPMQNSDQMTIEKTHPTLEYICPHRTLVALIFLPFLLFILSPLGARWG